MLAFGRVLGPGILLRLLLVVVFRWLLRLGSQLAGSWMFKTTHRNNYHKRMFCTFMISHLIHIYKYVQSRVIILNQHVSATLVTIIRVSYNNNTINIQIILQSCSQDYPIRVGEEYQNVTKLLVNKTKRCTEFQFYWYYDSTCFGQPFCPSSGVLSRTLALVHFMQLWWTVCYQE
jgi:hypothetical protein